MIQAAEKRLSPKTRRSWRWRILALRALIDHELLKHQGRLEGETLKAAFDELTAIYHAENAHSMPKGCPIIYSLGDFIFDFEDPAKVIPEALNNWILRLTLDKGGVVTWDTVVSRTDEDGLPQPVASVSDPIRSLRHRQT